SDQVSKRFEIITGTPVDVLSPRIHTGREIPAGGQFLARTGGMDPHRGAPLMPGSRTPLNRRWKRSHEGGGRRTRTVTATATALAAAAAVTVSLTGAGAAPAAHVASAEAAETPYTWDNAQIAGGGFVPGIVFNETEP